MLESINDSNAPLCWNVIYGSFNRREIRACNIFDHGGFWKDCVDASKKYGNDKETFSKKIKSSLMYYFWSKCEWEVIVSHWPPSERMRDIKIDVYDQIMLNWKLFIEYVWSNRNLLR